MTIEELRIQIDELDRQLVELLSERARAAQTIGRMKAATSLPVYEPDRERSFTPTCARPTRVRCPTSS